MQFNIFIIVFFIIFTLSYFIREGKAVLKKKYSTVFFVLIIIINVLFITPMILNGTYREDPKNKPNFWGIIIANTIVALMIFGFYSWVTKVDVGGSGGGSGRRY